MYSNKKHFVDVKMPNNNYTKPKKLTAAHLKKIINAKYVNDLFKANMIR